MDLNESQLLEEDSQDSQEMEVVQSEDEIKILNGYETPPAKIKRSAKGSNRRTRKSSKDKKKYPDYKPSHPVNAIERKIMKMALIKIQDQRAKVLLYDDHMRLYLSTALILRFSKLAVL